MKGKSLYLCNRFREGEPLKMTDWQSWGYGRQCWLLHWVSYLAMCKGARKGKPHAFWKPSKNFFFESFLKKISRRFSEGVRLILSRSLAHPQGKILGAAVSTVSRSLSSSSLSSSAALPLESGCKGTDFFLSCNFYTILFCRNFSVF